MRYNYLCILAVVSSMHLAARGADQGPASLNAAFPKTVRPFLQQYCVSCHGDEDPEADLNLDSIYLTFGNAAKDSTHWGEILERLESKEMPPRKAKAKPTDEARRQVIEWFRAARGDEMRRNAGDPGVVLARRLNNAEYDNTIRDLIGADIRPAREFPADLTNTAGFDNSGETLVMSPTLLNKSLQAAHEVANHMFLKPDGIGFSPTVMLVETDRDQYCVQQIIGLYHRQNTDYADYFLAAWRFKHRTVRGRSGATLNDFAADANVSAKYLATIWSMLEVEKAEAGPLLKLQSLWKHLPAPLATPPDAARKGCEQMREYVVQFRRKVEPRFLNLGMSGRGGNGQGGGSTALIMWKNVQYATHRMTFDPGQLQVEGEPMPVTLDVSNEPNASGEFGPGRTVPVINTPGDSDLVVPAGKRDVYEAAFAKFCSVFPDRFYMEERGRNYFDTKKDRGRFLSAGFHSQMGYFRDDQPLYELMLDEKQQKELDDLWMLFDFMSRATERLYIESGSGRTGGRGAATQPTTAPGTIAREPTSDMMIKQAEARFIAAAGNPAAEEAGRYFYGWVNKTVRAIEKAKIEAVPKHLEVLQQFATGAYRRPLTPEERADLRRYYTQAREKDGLDHEAAMRESIVAVLMSPDFSYRIDLLKSGQGVGPLGVHPLSDYELASRLSYFLWSSMPDDELLAHAAEGDLHYPKIIAAQAKRMLRDPRVRALAMEFGGNWLEFRRFGEITTVDRDHFKSFSNDLRDAMFEEPVRFLTDVFRSNRPVLDLLYGNDTFVNPILARHYGMPVPDGRAGDWVHVPDATPYQRGGLLPMAVFLTKNAPGLRTSPVKRGNWVVKNVLGERVPPPPPGVPAIPQDESTLEKPLRETLARHRNDSNCASCHDRIDSFGLVFEGFGPIGERREKDLAGRAVDISATFPGGAEGSGVQGLRRYISGARQNDFVNNLCGKLVVYCFGRSFITPDELLIQEMRTKLAADGYRFDAAIETIVTSKQFLNKRGHPNSLKGNRS
jgi:hypothetical protein